MLRDLTYIASRMTTSFRQKTQDLYTANTEKTAKNNQVKGSRTLIARTLAKSSDSRLLNSLQLSHRTAGRAPALQDWD